jgi:hypothetical protein
MSRIKYSQTNGQPFKIPCRLSTTANISNVLTGAPNLVDGVSLSIGDRMLVKNQNTASQNGIYTVVTVGSGNNGIWSRSDDFTDDIDVFNGVQVYVVSGNVGSETTYYLSSPDPIQIGVDDVVFTKVLPDFISGTGSDNRIVRWDGTNNIQDSNITISDSGNITGVGDINISGTASVQGKFKLNDGTEANGYVLVSDANGVASWTQSLSNFSELDDVNITSALTDQTLRYNGTDWVNQSDLNISSTGEVGIGTSSNPSYSLMVGGDVNIDGTLFALSKSFDIVHPSDDSKRLRYGSLEGPEYGVYHRGKLVNENLIVLPDYWKDLVNIDTITVQLTPIGSYQELYVGDIKIYKDINIIISNNKGDDIDINCYYIVHAERKDIDKIIVEY